MNKVADRVFLAISGGILSSEAIVLRPDGTVVARAKGAGSSQQKMGMDQAMESIAALARGALEAAELPAGVQPGRIGAFLAGIDLPVERARAHEALAAQFPGVPLIVENDIHAVLWAGLRRPAGAAVICGDGINAIARSATGRTAGYLALGTISGEWGGGLTLGREVLFAASRAEDGRGPQTSLRYRVAAHLMRPTAREAIADLHLTGASDSTLVGLVPVLFEADASGDAVSRDIIERLAGEIVLMARAAMDRVHVPPTGSDVVLAGSVLTAGYQRLDELVEERFAAELPGAAVHRLALPLVVGAALACIGADRGGPVSSDRHVRRMRETLEAAPSAENLDGA